MSDTTRILFVGLNRLVSAGAFRIANTCDDTMNVRSGYVYSARLEMLDRLNLTIGALSQAIEQEVEKCPEAQRLRTHPGVGPLTALALVLIIGKPDRFPCGKQIASYLGLVPLEDSSGNRRRLTAISADAGLATCPRIQSMKGRSP